MTAAAAEDLDYLRAPDSQGTGAALHAFVTELYPICRSITGDGVRATLDILRRSLPITVHEVPTGTPVFDWTVPQEWNIRDAYIKDGEGRRVVDFKASNLHVVSYSTPIHETMPLGVLRDHLFSLPEKPEWIPYRTAYYKKDWGFCLTHNQLTALKDGMYEVCIDATLEDGHLTYGELLIPGASANEVLISAHICHPSLCNDNLSGISIAAHLAKKLIGMSLRYSYRFVFMPATIGSITWLAANEATAERIKHGLILACAGDPGSSTYKKSRRGNAEIDRAVAVVLRDSGAAYEVNDFLPYGYDERQYCSPGFNLAVGSLMRTPNGRFPEYHTSADNPDFVTPDALADSLSKVEAALFLLEHNRRYVNRNPKCEPQLGRRGIYRALSDQKGDGRHELAMLWVLNLSDGEHTLLDIAERSALSFAAIRNAAALLLAHDLLIERTDRIL